MKKDTSVLASIGIIVTNDGSAPVIYPKTKKESTKR